MKIEVWADCGKLWMLQRGAYEMNGAKRTLREQERYVRFVSRAADALVGQLVLVVRP